MPEARDDVSWPEGITEADKPALDALAAAGVHEGELDPADAHDVPADLVELYEVMEWQAAADAEGGE